MLVRSDATTVNETGPFEADVIEVELGVSTW